MDSRAPRRDRSLCCRSPGPSHRRVSGLCRKLRAGKRAPRQRSFRLSPQPRACARHRRSNSQQTKLEVPIFKRPTPTGFSRIAVTTPSLFPKHPKCRGSWKSPSAPRSPDKAFLSSPFRETSQSGKFPIESLVPASSGLSPFFGLRIARSRRWP